MLQKSIQSSYVAGPRPTALANRYLTTASTSRGERKSLPAGACPCPFLRACVRSNAYLRPARPLVLRKRVRAVQSQQSDVRVVRGKESVSTTSRVLTCCERRLNRWTRCFGCRLVGRSLPHGRIKRGMSQRCQGSKHLVANTAGRYTALFKVVLCTWGKIVGERVWVAISPATSGCKSFRLGRARIGRYPEDRVEQEYLRHYCAGRLERNSNSKAEMIFVDFVAGGGSTPGAYARPERAKPQRA